MGDLERAEAAGQKYADEVLLSDSFHDWVWEEMVRGEELGPADVAPGLETENVAKDKRAAERLAKNLLQQLVWDINRDMEDSDVERALESAGIEDVRENYKKLGPAYWAALRGVLGSPDARTWLAEELIMPFATKLLKKKRRR